MLLKASLSTVHVEHKELAAEELPQVVPDKELAVERLGHKELAAEEPAQVVPLKELAAGEQAHIEQELVPQAHAM